MIYYLLFLILSVKTDNITVYKPISGDIVEYGKNLEISYRIERYGLLYLSNTTIDVFDEQNTSIHKIFSQTYLFGNVTNSFQLPNTQTLNEPVNYLVTITGYGSYIKISGLEYMQIQYNIPIKIIPETNGFYDNGVNVFVCLFFLCIII